MSSPPTAYADSLAKTSRNQERPMFASPKGPMVVVACVLFAAGLASPAGIDFVLAAEQPSAKDIIKALKPPSRLTRSLTSPAEAASAAEEARFVDTLRNRATRSLTSDEREKIVS